MRLLGAAGITTGMNAVSAYSNPFTSLKKEQVMMEWAKRTWYIPGFAWRKVKNG
jgi:hypothetical protein